MRKSGILVVSIIGIILLITVSGSVSAAGSESITLPVCSNQHNVTITLYEVNIPGAGSTGKAVIPVWISGQSGSFQLEAKNGIPPYHWAVKPGSQLPGQGKSQGFSLSERGVLSGTAPVLPSGQETKLSPSFTVMVWDSDTPPTCDEESLTITFEQPGVSTPVATTIPPTAPILTVATILPTTSEPTSAKTEPTTAISITTTRAPSTTLPIVLTVSPTSPTPSTATTVVQNQPAAIPDFIGWIIKIILPSSTPVPAIPTIEPTPSEPTIVTTEPTTPTSAITTIRPTLPTTTLTTIPPTVLTPTRATIEPTITLSTAAATAGQIQPENKPDFIGGLIQFFTGLLPGVSPTGAEPSTAGHVACGFCTKGTLAGVYITCPSGSSCASDGCGCVDQSKINIPQTKTTTSSVTFTTAEQTTESVQQSKKTTEFPSLEGHWTGTYVWKERRDQCYTNSKGTISLQLEKISEDYYVIFYTGRIEFQGFEMGYLDSWQCDNPKPGNWLCEGCKKTVITHTDNNVFGYYYKREKLDNFLISFDFNPEETGSKEYTSYPYRVLEYRGLVVTETNFEGRWNWIEDCLDYDQGQQEMCSSNIIKMTKQAN